MPCATITQTVPRALALHADAGRRGCSGARPCRNAVITSSSWRLLIGQPLQLEVDRHVRGDRRRGRERRDVLGRRVDDRDELVDVGEVLQRLDPAGGRAGADRDELPRRPAHLLDPLRRRAAVVTEPSTSERSYGPSTVALRRLEEVGDLDLAREREQLVLAVEQRELAAVAGGELPDGERRLAGLGLTARAPPSGRRSRRSGRPGRRGRSASGRAGSGRSARAPQCMLRSIET